MFIYLPFKVLFLYVCFFFYDTLKKSMYVFTFFAACATESRCICPLDFLKRLNMLIFFFLGFLRLLILETKKQFAFKLIILILV